MEIIISGTGKKSVKPDKIVLNFNFETKSKTYEEVLSLGTKNVQDYITMLEKFGFKKEDIKTKSFSISEDMEYNQELKKYIKKGFIYSQNVKLEFLLDLEKLANIIEETSHQSFAPKYQITFETEDTQKIDDEVLTLAYQDAEKQAKSIANASGKKVLECKKVSFQPFEENHISQTRICEMCCKSGSFQNIFVPEDVIVSKTIYCIFVTD